MSVYCWDQMRLPAGGGRDWSTWPCSLDSGHEGEEHRFSGSLDDGTAFTLTWIKPAEQHGRTT